MSQPVIDSPPQIRVISWGETPAEVDQIDAVRFAVTVPPKQIARIITPCWDRQTSLVDPPSFVTHIVHAPQV